MQTWKSSIQIIVGHLLVLVAIAVALSSCSDPLAVDTPRKTVVDPEVIDTVVSVPGIVKGRSVSYLIYEERGIWSSGQLVNSGIAVDTLSVPPRLLIGSLRFERPPFVPSWLYAVRLRSDTALIDNNTFTLRYDLTLGDGMQLICNRFQPTRNDTLRSGDNRTSTRMTFRIDRDNRVVSAYYQYTAYDYYYNFGNDYTIDVTLTINY